MSDVEASNRLKAAYARNNIPYDPVLDNLSVHKKLELAEHWDDRADEALADADDGPEDDWSDHDRLEHIPITQLGSAKAIRRRLHRLAGVNHPTTTGERAQRASAALYHGDSPRDN